MAFFAQTGPSAEARLSEKLGGALAQGVARNFPAPETLVAQTRLRDAMQKLQPGATLSETLRTVGPELLTTPQGAPLLESLLQLQQKEAGSRAIIDYLRTQMGETPTEQKAIPSEEVPKEIPAETGISPKKDRREIKAPVSETTPFPKQTIAPTPIPIPTANDIAKMTSDVMAQEYALTGQVNPTNAANLINSRIQQIRDTNREIQDQQQRLSIAQDKLVSDGKSRAQTEGLFQDEPKDASVFERFMNEAKNAENPADAYKYARAKTLEYQTMRNGILRNLDLPGKATQFYRRLIGTHKEKEQVMDDLQPQIQSMVREGFEREARDLLVNSVGMGPEDAERTLFPLTKEQKSLYNSFPSNPNKGGKEVTFEKVSRGEKGFAIKREGFILKGNQFDKFKSDLKNLLDKDPEANLVALRGDIVFDKNYDWQDYSKALNQLINEGEFDPDFIQKQQLNVIKEAPIPGLTEQFNFFWKGTR